MDRDDWLIAAYILLVLVMLASIIVPTVVAFAQGDDNLRRILADAGYSEIQSTGYRWLSCSDDDVFRQGFKATGPTGKPVSGTLCSNWFKGHTIRLD